MTFKDKLLNAAEKNKSWLCIGLDPDLNKLPSPIEKSPDGVFAFLKGVIDATQDLVCAFKPNSAFFERFGAAGMELLQKVISYVPETIPVILDAKRGDIGNTSRMYAIAAFEKLGADAITVNPYMGYDCVKPFIDYRDKGIFLLCLTSNQSSIDFQKKELSGGQLLYELVAEKAKAWDENSNIGLVVGATKPGELKDVRKLIGESMPILVPGVGAQGGDLEESLRNGGNSLGKLAIINVSRSVLYASKDENYADGSRRATLFLVNDIRKLVF